MCFISDFWKSKGPRKKNSHGDIFFSVSNPWKIRPSDAALVFRFDQNPRKRGWSGPQQRHPTYAAARFCHPSAGQWRRLTVNTNFVGPRRYCDNRNLYPCTRNTIAVFGIASSPAVSRFRQTLKPSSESRSHCAGRYNRSKAADKSLQCLVKYSTLLNMPVTTG